MDDFWRLLILSLSMFIGCYVSGSIPLILTLSEGVLRKVTTFGAGLLIGTALIVIIPEGMESLFGEALHSHNSVPLPSVDQVVGLVPRAALPMAVAAADNSNNNNNADSIKRDVEHQLQVDAAQNQDDKNNDKLDDLPNEGVELKPHAKAAVIPEESTPYTVEQLQFLLGLALVLGFVFMLLIDQCGGGHSHNHSTGDAESVVGGRHSRHNLTATIGLVFHAAADGLALGAAAGLSKVEVELIIFVAIMLHKAPAAFGFTTFLIHEGYDKMTAKKHLMVFALAAPVAAFFSYFGLTRIMYTVQFPITGFSMLLSAGTFLYVATVHVLNEITQGSAHSPSDSTPSPGSHTNGGSSGKLSRVELFLVVFGTFLPLLFNAIHSHSH